MKKLILLFVFLIACMTAAYSGELSVSQNISESDIAFEDSLFFEIIITWEGAQNAYWFNQALKPGLDRLKMQGIKSSISSEMIDSKEITTKKYLFTLKPTASGIGNIEAVTINYLKWPDSIPGEIYTEPMSVNIAAKQIVQLKKENFTIWYIIGGGLILLFGGGLIWYFRKSSQPAEVRKTAKEMFLDNLDNLKKNSSGELKPYLSGLHDILIEYLNNEHLLNIKEFRETEFLDKSQNTYLTEKQVEQLSVWLKRAQLAKYSPLKSTPGETIRLDTEVRDFFDEMK